MANITLDELRAKYPPEDREEYDRAYAAATLAGQLAELVYTLRTRAGLTQTELARRIGTTQSSIARIERGSSLPTLDMLARVAHATGSPLRIAAPGISDIDRRSRLTRKHCPNVRRTTRPDVPKKRASRSAPQANGRISRGKPSAVST